MIHCLKPDYGLMDDCEQLYRIRTDWQCRNHIYFPYDLALLNRLPDLAAAGIKRFRIDGQFYKPELLRDVIAIYQKAVDYSPGRWAEQDVAKLLGLFPDGPTAIHL